MLLWNAGNEKDHPLHVHRATEAERRKEVCPGSQVEAAGWDFQLWAFGHSQVSAPPSSAPPTLGCQTHSHLAPSLPGPPVISAGPYPSFFPLPVLMP